MGRTIKINESALNRIISEATRKVVKESVSTDVCGNLEQAKSLLKEITISGFIPFSSPSPSSTEEKLKGSITNAISEIEYSLYLYDKLYGRR